MKKKKILKTVYRILEIAHLFMHVMHGVPYDMKRPEQQCPGHYGCATAQWRLVFNTAI